MPVALEFLAGLGEVIVALFALLLAAAVYLLTQGLGRVLTWSLPIIGKVDLGGPFVSAGESVASWIVTQTKSMWVHLTTLMLGTAYMLDHTFNAAVRAIEQVFDYADHVVTVTIPHAIGEAAAYTRQHVSAAVTGIAADIVNAEHAVGTAVAGVVSGALTAAERYADHDLQLAHTYADQLEADTHTYIDTQISDLSTTIGRSISQLTSTVAADYTAAKNYASSQAAAALSTAQDLVKQATTTIEGVAQDDASTALTTAKGLVDDANTAISQLTSTVSTDLTAAEKYAQTQVVSGLQDVTSVIAGTSDLVGGAIGAAATGVADNIQGAITTAAGALTQAKQALGEALAGVAGDITGQAQAFNGDLAGIEGVLAGAISAAVAAGIAGVAARVTHLEDCSVGVCDDSTNNFSSLLNGALGLASLDGVGKFLARVIKDPAGAEHEYAGAVSGVYTSGRSLLDDILAL